jgi:hypothetical protein
MSYFFYTNSDAYKANAKRRRDMGGSTVRVYATSDAMYAARGGNVGPNTWECLLMASRERFKEACSEARERYLDQVTDRIADWEDFK